MVTLALLVRLEAKPGKEPEVESFLCGGVSLIPEEPEMTAWFSIPLGPSTFGNFDAFLDKAGVKAIASGLLALPPTIKGA